MASRELRNDTARLLRRVEAGERIVITRRGKPVADLVPQMTVRRPRGLTVEDVLKIRAITAGDPTFRRGFGVDRGRDHGRTRADLLSAPVRAKYGLLDTSVLVAAEVGRALRTEVFPETSSTSIVTVAELRAGIHAAPDVETRDRRIATYELVMSGPVIPIDGAVANAWSQMRACLAASGRKVNVNDIWVAATARLAGNSHRHPGP